MKTLSYFLPLFSLGTLSATEKEDITPIVNKWVRESRPKNQWPNELSGIINKYSDIEKEEDLDRLKQEKKQPQEEDPETDTEQKLLKFDELNKNQQAEFDFLQRPLGIPVGERRAQYEREIRRLQIEKEKILEELLYEN